jgi:hypothetical protein
MTHHDKRGQNGEALSISLEKFNTTELAIITALSKADGPLSNKEIREATGWVDDKGSSTVRNGLRRPCRAGWVQHASTVGDGRYLLTTYALGQLGLTQARPVPFKGNRDEHGCYPGAAEVKRPDCEMYNSCLDHALDNLWPNFGCHHCEAYQLLDTEQRVQDVLGLLAARMAAKNVAKMGVAGRTRGVKPGADAKVKKRKAQ